MSEIRLTRRTYLAASGMAIGGLLLQGTPAVAQTPLVRRNIRDLDPNGPEITQLREAFRIIESRPNGSSVGWLGQANIHRNRCAHANWWFFPWHRAYLFYFERILRAAVGDPTLALPYWDWSDPSTRAIPAPFWRRYLYRVIRGPGIGPSSLVPDELVDRDFIVEPILDIPAFSTFGGAASSSPMIRTAGGSLEGSPHNNVHNWIGGAMARPEWAAQDPIFWLHHANVDRLWAEWSRRHPGGLPTSPAWRNQTFSFFNTAGAPTTIAVSQVLTTGALNYRYDDEPAVPMPLAEAAGPSRAERAPETVAATPPRPVLGSTPITVTLTPTPELQTRVREFTAPQVRDDASAGTLLLAIEGIQAPDVPQVLVRVFINLPEANATTSPRDLHYAGNFSFFTSDAQGHDAHGPYTQYLDVTRAIRRLADADQYRADGPIQVTLMAVPIAPERRQEAATRIPFRRATLTAK